MPPNNWRELIDDFPDRDRGGRRDPGFLFTGVGLVRYK
jgi:hypothetical protein